MVDVKFKVVHRILLKQLIDSDGKAGSHPLSALSKMMKIQEAISFTEEEVKTLNLRLEMLPAPEGREPVGQWRWNTKRDNALDGEEVDLEKSFSFSDEQKDIVADILKRKNDAKEFTLGDAEPVLFIAEQFGVSV
jgi:hypothetical protein